MIVCEQSIIHWYGNLKQPDFHVLKFSWFNLKFAQEDLGCTSSTFIWTMIFTLEMFKQRQGSSLESFLIIGKVSSEAIIEAKRLQARSIFSKMNVWFEELLLEARLWGMQLAIWLLQVRKLLGNWLVLFSYIAKLPFLIHSLYTCQMWNTIERP